MSGVRVLFAMAIATTLTFTSCSDDGDGDSGSNAAPGPAQTGDLQTFCRASQDLKDAVTAQPLDPDTIGSLLVTFLYSAPGEIQPQVQRIVTVFVFPPGDPNVNEAVTAVRTYREANCPSG